MAIFSLTGATIWAGLSDLSNDTNQITGDMKAAVLDATTFASGGWSAPVGGLRSATMALHGLWDVGTADAPDNLFFGDVGVSGIPVTVTPLGATVTNVAYFGTFTEPTYKQGAKVGQLLTFDSALDSDSPMVRGQIANVTAKTSTGTTTGLNLVTAPTATQRVYCNLHVMTIAGTSTPTLTAVVQGDTTSGFSAPATIATSSAFTAAGSQQIKGAIGVTTNTWYRLSLTISGVGPSFLLYAAIGIA